MVATGTHFNRDRTWRRRKLASALALVAVVALVVAGPAGALIGGFEGGDGDESTGNTGGTLDWDNPTIAARATAGTSTDDPRDSSYKGGFKEDATSPGIVNGNVSAKSDLTGFRVAPFGGRYVALAWNRVTGGGGSVALNFELNKNAQPALPDPPGGSSEPWNLHRVAGDRLLTFDFTGGVLALHSSVWTTTGPCAISSTKSPPCWAAPTSLAGFAEGAVNGADPTFGEMVVDLVNAGIFSNVACTNFASVTAKTRASNQFDAQIEDVVAPIASTISNCAVDIIKVDDAGTRLANAEFTLYTDNAGAPGTAVTPAEKCVTGSTGTCSIGAQTAGTYWIVETVTPSGHTTAPAQQVVVAPGGNTPAGSFTFTNNRISESITVSKTVSGGPSGASFSFTVDCGTYNLTTTNLNDTSVDYTGGNASFSLTNGQSKSFTAVPVGTACTATETSAPGWTTTVSTNGATAVQQNQSGTMTSSTTAPQTAAFTNTFNTGSVTVSKATAPAGATDTFSFVLDCGDYALTSANRPDTSVTYAGTASFSLSDGQSKTFATIPAGTECTATETAATGWTTTVTPAGTTTATGTTSATLTVATNSTQTAAFTNTRETGAIEVTKAVTPSTSTETFQFSLSCADYPLSATNNANATYDANGVASFSLGHGGTATFSAIPTGTSCTASETADAGFDTTVKTGTAAAKGGTTSDAVTVTTGRQTIAFANTEKQQGCTVNCGPTYGSLTVLKQTTGGDGTFDFAVDCAGTNFDKWLSITTGNGTGSAPAITAIPTGTSCTITETVPAGWKADNAIRTVTVDGDETVTISNEKLAGEVSADLAIDKVDLADPVLVGEDVTYRLDVVNLGPDRATSVVVVDTLPAELALVSVDGDGCDEDAGVITCSLGDLEVDETRSVLVTVRGTAQGQFENIATVVGNEPDPDPVNNQASELTRFEQIATAQPTPDEPTPAPAPAPVAKPERLEVQGVVLARTGALIGVAATSGAAFLLFGGAVLGLSRFRSGRRRT